MAASGPATGLIEATAASIGAGMLLGGFLASCFALIFGLASATRDKVVVVGSTCAGVGSAAVLIVERALGG